MEFSHLVKYSTEGAPFFIGDARSAEHWSGRQYDGSGVILKYFGQGLETLPKMYALTQRTGGQRQKTFTTIQEADAFESELLRHLKELHPTAAKPAKYPDYPAYYVGATRVFGIERQFGSQFETALKKLKGRAAVIGFDKKHRSQALFFDPEGGGPGVIAATSRATGSIDTFVVSKITAADSDDDDVAAALGSTSVNRLKALGKLALEGSAVIFDASMAAAAVALHNWGEPSLLAVVNDRLTSTAFSAIHVPDQTVPGGAFLRIESGSYNYAVVRNARAGHTTWDALWLWRS